MSFDFVLQFQMASQRIHICQWWLEQWYSMKSALKVNGGRKLPLLWAGAGAPLP